MPATASQTVDTMSFGDETLNPTYAEEDHLRRQVADLTDEIERLRRERADLLTQVIQVLYPRCRPGHVLEDGQVWGLCGARRLVEGGVREDAISTMIRDNW